MRKFYKIKVLVLMVLALLSEGKAQNYTAISQYMYQQALFNPAAMGSYSEFSAALLVRKQWVGVDGAPQLFAFNGSIPFGKMNLGLSVFHKEIGVQKETSFFVPYSYRLNLSKHQYLTFGISAGGILHDRDYASLVTNNDPVFSSNINKITPNFQLGAYLFGKKYYLGLYSPGMLRSNLEIENNEVHASVDFDKKYLHLFFQGGYEYDLNREMKLNVSTLVKYTTYMPVEVDVNAMLSLRNWIGIGVSYRTNKEILGLMKVRLNHDLQLAYAYQHSKIKREGFQSHEVMLLFNFNRKVRKGLIIQSPRF
jgi:type IX secretion system PorP/SprF family membrane protein